MNIYPFNNFRKMESEQDLFKITFDLPSPVATSHEIPFEITKLVIHAQKPVVLTIKVVPPSGKGIELYDFRVDINCNVLCLCKYR